MDAQELQMMAELQMIDCAQRIIAILTMFYRLSP